MIHLRKVLPIGHQTAGLYPFLRYKHARQPLLYSEVDDLFAVLKGQRILQDEKCVGALLGHHGKSGLKVLQVSQLVGLKRYSERMSRTLRLSPSECECG